MTKEEREIQRGKMIYAYDEQIKENNYTILKLKELIKQLETRNKFLDNLQHNAMFRSVD